MAWAEAEALFGLAQTGAEEGVLVAWGNWGFEVDVFYFFPVNFKKM